MMVLGKEHITGSLRYENKIVYQHPEYILEDIKRVKREKMDIRPRQPQAVATPSNLEGEKGSSAAAFPSRREGCLKGGVGKTAAQSPAAAISSR